LIFTIPPFTEQRMYQWIEDTARKYLPGQSPRGLRDILHNETLPVIEATRISSAGGSSA